VRYVVLFAQESKLSVYDLWLIVICLYNRVILDDFIPEFCNFEIGHSRILQFSHEDSEYENLLKVNLINELRRKMSAQNQPERGFCIKNKPERGFSQYQRVAWCQEGISETPAFMCLFVLANFKYILYYK